jgi:predicted TIM-barrel fold metal-dependent hydrolase
LTISNAVDVFMRPPWTPEARERWATDPMIQRVMRTFRQTGEQPRTPDRSLEQVLEDMDKTGIARGVMQCSMYYHGSQEELEQIHGTVYSIVEKYPDRFVGVATIRPPVHGPGSYWDVMENVRWVEKAVKEWGFQGLHLLPAPYGTPPNHKWFYPVYAKCVELQIPVFTYVGMPGPLWPMEPNNPAHLDEVALAFPDLVIIAHHIGDPWVNMMCHLAGKHDNVHMCTSAWSPKRYPEEFVRFIKKGWHGTRGRDKILFGTDYPLLELDEVQKVNDLDLDEDIVECFLSRNAAKLFRWG